MYSKMIVPLDGSELAESILPYASLLAKGLQISVELLQAIEPASPVLTNPSNGFNLEQVVHGMRLSAQQYLEKIAITLQDDGILASYEVFDGDPAAQILAKAQQNPNALIAISTHGRSGASRWVLGSVTNKVIQATSNPLLVVRSHERPSTVHDWKLSTLIVPLDGSPGAEQIVLHVVALAKAMNMKVMLARVIPTGQIFYERGQFASYRYEDAYAFMKQEAVEYMRRIGLDMRLRGVASVEERLLHGRPADSIADLAHEIEERVISMTTHGRSGIGRWILGSVADQVVSQSGVPVLLVRTVE